MFSKRVKKGKISQSGQTLMEIVVVVAISAIVIGALVIATIASLRNAQFSKNQAQATKLAQEGMERVRAGRDQDLQVSISSNPAVAYWNGRSSSACPLASQVRSDSFWCYRISSGCGQTNPCYFNISSSSVLDDIGGSASFPASQAEGIPQSSPVFRRAVIVTDDASYASQKTVTVIVSWNDFSGPHESRLTTILRKL